ncbi:MAG TPA: holin family protein [Methanosarcina sp.]|nr:holin family protein [Methanosarcina sp.]
MAGIDLTGITSIVDFGSKLIDRIFPDKIAQADQRDKAQLALLNMQQNGELTELQERMKAIVTEASSADPWTSRARPSFMYVIYIMILMSIPMGVLSAFNPVFATAVISGMKAWLAAIPQELYTLFGVGYVGYAYQRSKEKIAGVTK